MEIYSPDRSSVVFPYKLNEQQYLAVHAPFDVPLLISAGPGTGKTLTIVCRIVNMIASGINPSNILAFSFTRKSSQELQERIVSLCKRIPNIPPKSQVSVSTFHKFCLKVLRDHREFLDENIQRFRLCSRKDQETFLEEIFVKWTNRKNPLSFKSAMEIPTAAFELKRLSRNCLSFIGQSKAFGIPFSNIKDDFKRFICQHYQRKLEKSNKIDFNDLINKASELFRHHPNLTKKYQAVYKYILIDEFQDTSITQWNLVSLLSGHQKRITVVGDMDQSIYSFRGATLHNFTSFKALSSDPQPTEISLTQNYRSTKQIITAASNVIHNNNQQRPRKDTLWTENMDDTPPLIVSTETSEHEITFILDLIQDKKRELGLKFRDIAILYRSRFVGRLFEPELQRRKIRFGLNGQASFYHREEVRDILAYLRVLADKTDDIAFERVFFLDRRLHRSSFRTIKKAAKSHRVSYFKAAILTLQYNESRSGSAAPNTQQKSLQKLIQMIKKLRSDFLYKEPLDTLIEKIIQRTNYLGNLWKRALDTDDNPDLDEIISLLDDQQCDIEEDTDPKIKSGLGLGVDSGSPEEYNLIKLKNEALSFEQAFLNPQSKDEEITPKKRQDILISFLEAVSYGYDNADEDYLTLTTIHQAKGLEWPLVCLVRSNEGVIPSLRPQSLELQWNDISCLVNPSPMEEERRIFYVGMTRAARLLIMSSISYDHQLVRISASRFLKESGISQTIVAPVNDQREELTKDQMMLRSSVLRSPASLQRATSDLGSMKRKLAESPTTSIKKFKPMTNFILASSLPRFNKDAIPFENDSDPEIETEVSVPAEGDPKEELKRKYITPNRRSSLKRTNSQVFKEEVDLECK